MRCPVGDDSLRRGFCAQFADAIAQPGGALKFLAFDGGGELLFETFKAGDGTVALDLIRQIAQHFERSFALELKGFIDRKSTRLNSSHIQKSRMPSSA